MGIGSVKARVLRNLSNVPGWRTNKKILVLESDDWGSIRMPSIEVHEAMKEKGLCPYSGTQPSYNAYDTLASADDLSELFGVLSSFKDESNHPCVMTPVSLVANPNFERIEKNGFETYYHEPMTATLERYYPNSKVFDLWKEGISSGVFIPQFHGREHLNIAEWMRALRSNDADTRFAFSNGCWGFRRRQSNGHPLISFQAAFDLHEQADLNIQGKSIEEGLQMFHSIFGYTARFFVPPNGPFNRSLEKIAAMHGIRYMSTPKIQIEPLGKGQNRRVLHWLGQKNNVGQRYLIRNCFFEPWQGGIDWVERCLKEIEIAFNWKKPAVVSSHRINYIGALNLGNREKGLKLLSRLLTRIQNRWPDVMFLSSAELGALIDGQSD